MRNNGARRRIAAQALAVIVFVAMAVPPAGAAATRGAAPSPGCAAAPPAQPPTILHVDGRERTVIVGLPKDFNPKIAHDLIIAFHGRTNSNAEVRGYYDLERHAQRPTIFVYPSGLSAVGGTRSWSDPGDTPDDLRDYALFDAVVAVFARLYCLDLDRVLAVGHSLGAWFVNSLGCARADRLRAIATLGGGVSASDCRGTLAALLAHNPEDRLVAFQRGEAARDLFLGLNGLEGPPRPTPPTDLACLRYGAAVHPNPVVWCPHPISITWRGRYYPHQWPRGTGAAVMAFLSGLP